MATLNSHGMEPQEERIMDLWDAGLSVPEIARQLGLPVGRVTTVTNNLSENRSDLWAARARKSSADLLRAIAAYHPEALC